MPRREAGKPALLIGYSVDRSGGRTWPLLYTGRRLVDRCPTGTFTSTRVFLSGCQLSRSRANPQYHMVILGSGDLVHPNRYHHTICVGSDFSLVLSYFQKVRHQPARLSPLFYHHPAQRIHSYLIHDISPRSSAKQNTGGLKLNTPARSVLHS